MYKNPKQILVECERRGATVLAMTNLPSHFEMGYPHVRAYNKIRLALGLHPLYVEQHDAEFPIFLKALEKTSYIGEVGLDFSREGYLSKDAQLASFNKILSVLSNKKKILSIHSRRAEKEVFNFLLQYSIKGAIFHWYSGPISLIKEIAEAGFYFSVNIAMANSENGKKIINKIPLNSLLTETDGPFTKNDGRETLPYEMDDLLSKLATIKNTSANNIEAIITNNFSRLVGLIK